MAKENLEGKIVLTSKDINGGEGFNFLINYLDPKDNSLMNQEMIVLPQITQKEMDGFLFYRVSKNEPINWAFLITPPCKGRKSRRSELYLLFTKELHSKLEAYRKGKYHVMDRAKGLSKELKYEIIDNCKED